jgi:hypothetical protein
MCRLRSIRSYWNIREERYAAYLKPRPLGIT